MMRHHPCRPASGVTLVELLVAWTLGLLLVTAIVGLQAPLIRWVALQHALARMDEDARHVLDLLAREVAMAGYLGCRVLGERTPAPARLHESTSSPAGQGDGSTPDVHLPSASSAVTLPTDGRDPAVLMVLGARGSQPLARLPREMPGDGAAGATPGDTGLTLSPATALRGFDSPPRALFGPGARAPLDGSPVLFLARAGHASVTLLTDQDASEQPLSVDPDEAAWLAGAGPGDVFDLVLSDCRQATLLRATVQTQGDAARLHHGVMQGNRSAALALAAVYPQEAQIMPLEWRLYYLALGPGAASPGLHEVLYDGHQRRAAQEIVDGIESLQFRYGLHNGAARPPHLPVWPSTWVDRARDVPDWSRVVALQVRLVMMAPSSSLPRLGRQAGMAGVGVPPLRRAFERTLVRRPGMRVW